jgi:bacterioferritin (cytochrome b1)
MEESSELSCIASAPEFARMVVSDWGRTFSLNLFHKACDFERADRFVDHHIYLDGHPQFRSDYLRTVRESDRARSEFVREFIQLNGIDGESHIKG